MNAEQRSVLSPSMYESSTGSTVSSGVMGFLKSKKIMVVLGLIITVVVGFTVGWIIYRIVQTKSIDRKSFIVPETENPVLGSVVTRGNGTDIPDALNGKRFSFSFWMYIHNLDKNSGIMKHVLHRGDEKDAMSGSPTVFMDPSINKLYIAFDTIDSKSVQETDKTELANETNFVKLQYASAMRGITVDYVPIQRWVHIGVVVNENVNGGSIASYVDGELVKTSTTNKKVTVTGTLPVSSTDATIQTFEVTPKLTNMSLDRKGNVYVGGSSESSTGVGFSGLVSLVQFFNYDLNVQDMYNIYTQGPIYLTAAGKFANTIGIGSMTNQYGVRNPVYRKPEIFG